MRNRADFSYDSPTVPDNALFVTGDGISPVYPSVAAAERALNPVSAENGRHAVAYGPKGQRFSVARKGRRVSVQPTGEPDAPEELRLLLVQHLKDTDQSVLEAEPISELVERVWRLERDFWNANDPYGERFGRHIPWWGCVGFILVVATAVFALIR